MALTLTRMRALVRKGLGGLDSDDLPDDDVDELLNLSLWALSEKFPFKEKECLVTTNTVAGQTSYTLPTKTDAIQVVGIVHDETNNFHRLRRMTEDWYMGEGNETDDEHQTRPTHWLRRDMGLILYPTPDDVYQIRIIMWRTVASLDEGVVDAPDLPRNWHEIVVEGAITRGHYYSQDYNLAQQAENFRLGHERNAVLDVGKEEEASRYAGLDVAWDEPD